MSSIPPPRAAQIKSISAQSKKGFTTAKDTIVSSMFRAKNTVLQKKIVQDYMDKEDRECCSCTKDSETCFFCLNTNLIYSWSFAIASTQTISSANLSKQLCNLHQVLQMYGQRKHGVKPCVLLIPIQFSNWDEMLTNSSEFFLSALSAKFFNTFSLALSAEFFKTFSFALNAAGAKKVMQTIFINESQLGFVFNKRLHIYSCSNQEEMEEVIYIITRSLGL